MDSSEESWLVDNVSLHQFGWSVSTVGGARYDVPPRRGSNIQLAYRPGQVHRRKLPDSRVITVLMWTVGADPATGSVVGLDQRVQWNDNWNFLRRLVYKAYTHQGQVVLGRRWRLTQPTFPTTRVGDICIQGDPGVPLPGSQLIYSNATAELTSDMAPQMTGRTRAEFQMDFLLADPYFYGAYVDVTLNAGDYVYVWNDGNDTAGHAVMEVDFIGPLLNPVLTNFSTEPDSWVKYTGYINPVKTVHLDVGRFLATIAPTNSTVIGDNVVGMISGYGARLWVNLLPGMNKLMLTATSGTGHVELRFRPPYI